MQDFSIGSPKTVIGKSEAREQFLPIVKALAKGSGPIEIADRGKSVAVIISKQEYDWMKAQVTTKPRAKQSLKGSIIILGDLEEGSREIAKAFRKSIEKTAKKL